MLNVDGSCHESPVRTGFGGILRSNVGRFISAFSGFIPSSSDILLAELTAIYHGLIVSKDLGIDELVCYSNSLLCINIVNGPAEKFHIYAVLI